MCIELTPGVHYKANLILDSVVYSYTGLREQRKFHDITHFFELQYDGKVIESHYDYDYGHDFEGTIEFPNGREWDKRLLKDYIIDLA